MLVRYGKFLVVVALVFTTGLHWTALQTVAWAGMLAHNLRAHSVTEAVTDTFDGKHPCCLCRAIAAAKKSDKKNEAATPQLKLEFPVLADQIRLFAPLRLNSFPPVDAFAAHVSVKPPLPPPRNFPV